MQVIQTRGSLHRTRQAIQNKQIRIGFIGGSITESFASYRSYSEHIINRFAACYPDVRVTFRNAGIGATGSAIGVFRVDEACIHPTCDLVFVEFAVNDRNTPTEERNATREGLIRKLLYAGCDVAVVYTHCSEMMPYMEKHEVPPTIREFETLCEHYRLPSVWMGLHALNAVKEGVLRYEEWLPDRLHPETMGSSVYADAVCAWLFDTLENGRDEDVSLPAPLYTDVFEHTHVLPLDSLCWKNPWKLRSMSNKYPFTFQEQLETSAIGAVLDIPFTGTGLVICRMQGRHAAAMQVAVDGGAPVLFSEPPHAWEGDLEQIKYTLICSGLERGKHTVRVTNVFGEEAGSIGTRLAIALVGVIE